MVSAVTDTPASRRRQAVIDQAREVAAGWSGPDAPASWWLTAALLDALADDADLLDLAEQIDPEKLPALLFVACVCRLVRLHPTEPLAAMFPRPGETQPPPTEDFSAQLHRFVLSHADELLALAAAHRYQMNEPARCLAMALGVAAGVDPHRPISLVDVGTGSGLGLHLDRYRFEVDGLSFGAPGSPVLLRATLAPPTALAGLATSLPAIRRRVGVDLDPIDLSDSEDRAWLLACAPPEIGCLARLAAAISVAEQHPTELVRGDGAALLGRLLAAAADEASDDTTLVVTDAFTAVFFDAAQRAAMAGAVDDLGRNRDVIWVSLDPLVPLGPHGTDSVQGQRVPPELVERSERDGVFALLGVVRWQGGQRTEQLLATVHPSGTAITWLG